MEIYCQPTEFKDVLQEPRLLWGLPAWNLELGYRPSGTGNEHHWQLQTHSLSATALIFSRFSLRNLWEKVARRGSCPHLLDHSPWPGMAGVRLVIDPAWTIRHPVAIERRCSMFRRMECCIDLGAGEIKSCNLCLPQVKILQNSVT